MTVAAGRDLQPPQAAHFDLLTLYIFLISTTYCRKQAAKEDPTPRENKDFNERRLQMSGCILGYREAHTGGYYIKSKHLQTQGD